MAPTKKVKPQGGNFEHEKLLQAVVVADRFDERFAPLTDDLPLALFPIANKPLIAYTLDFLASSGVQQIYVYCSSHSGQIREYLADSKWSAKSSQCEVTPMISSDFTSLGDVLRDIDQKALFENDFLLVNGDLIANISLDDALSEHRARRNKDKNKPLMTLLLRNCAPNHVTRTAEDDIVVALDSSTSQILHYQKIVQTGKARFDFPLKHFIQNGCSKFDLKYNLIDAGVAICSPQVPQLFTDNFDYQTKEDFIKGILINEEFLGNQIHVHTVPEGYAARVSTLHMYDTVSRAVTCRWVYPYVPDNNFESPVRPWSNKEKKDTGAPSSPLPYRHLRRNVYIGDIKSIGKDSLVEDNSVVGHGTTIGKDCRIMNAIIGRDCVIGNNVIIRDSYVWPNVTIDDGCTVEKSVLSNLVVIHENTILRSGCVLASKVEVGPNATLNEGTVIHVETEEDTFAEGEKVTKKEADPAIIGSKGRGVLWSNVDVDDSDEEMDSLREGIWGMSLSERERMYPTYSDVESSEDEMLSDESDLDDYKSDDEDNSVKLFFREVKDSLTRGVEESVKCDNLILEINSSKYAYNVTIFDVIRNVTKAVFEIAHAKSNGASFFPTVKKVLLHLCPVFVNYNKSSQSQIECMHEIERYCLQNKHAYECLIKILMVLYENDVLAEEVIIHWHKKPSSVEFAGDSEITPEELRSSVSKFIDWLQEAEEESSDDSS